MFRQACNAVALRVSLPDICFIIPTQEFRSHSSSYFGLYWMFMEKYFELLLTEDYFIFNNCSQDTY